MSTSHRHSDAGSGAPSAREIAAFVHARRPRFQIQRSAAALRRRIPEIPPALRAVLIAAFAWVGIAQWIGFMIRLLRVAVEG